MKQTIRNLALFTMILFVISCASSHGSWGTAPRKSKGRVSSPSQRKGPPPHAPAHGYRAKHRYYYYSSCSVYFDIDRRVYFYLAGDSWKMAAELPLSLRTKLKDHVTLELDTDKPYTVHGKHQKKSKPGHGRKKK